MVNMANIVCKTVGIAGLSAVVYDAYGQAKHHAKVGEEKFAADVYEKAIDARRSTETQSQSTAAMQRRISNLRMKNPIIPVLGKTKGFISGFLNGLGGGIIPIIFSSLAIAGKGFWQKAGAWGLGIFAFAKILHEGFGVGKATPMKD